MILRLQMEYFISEVVQCDCIQTGNMIFVKLLPGFRFKSFISFGLKWYIIVFYLSLSILYSF